MHPLPRNRRTCCLYSFGHSFGWTGLDTFRSVKEPENKYFRHLRLDGVCRKCSALPRRQESRRGQAPVKLSTSRWLVAPASGGVLTTLGPGSLKTVPCGQESPVSEVCVTCYVKFVL